MDSDHGGLSSSERQRQTAAELARKKVLAAYSSTLNTVKNLPRDSRDILLKNRQVEQPPTNQTSNYQAPEYQRVQPDWSHQTPNTNYERAPIYSTPTENPYAPNYNTPQSVTPEPVHETAMPTENIAETPSALKDTAINQQNINEEWAKYHSAWQDYYKQYYSEYYAKAAQNYLATEKMKNERTASGKVHRQRNLRRLIPVFIVTIVILTGLFLQYNRLIFAPLMAYISPDTNDTSTSLSPVDPTITQAVSAEPRLIIPKLNVDVPVEFNIPLDTIDAAMNRGVAQFAIPGANAMPGQVGNLVISGHSAGDIYSSNPYKFIFSGLERLENGDLIYVNYESVRYTYQMTGREVVEPTDVASLIYETDKPILTLITCTPLGTSRYRLLITAEQINPTYDSENVQTPEETPDSPNSNDTSMPANEPSFFENIWSGLFSN